MRGTAAAVCLSVLLAGCATLQNKVDNAYSTRDYGEKGTFNVPSGAPGGAPTTITTPQKWTFTTANIRMVTQRRHPVLGNEVVCAEPAPDVALALSTAAGLAAQGGSGTVNAGVNMSSASSEAVAELAGRSTALLGLRDGLYRACEAYTNGILGEGAYALVVARYAQLMTTLFLAQDVTGAAGANNKGTASSGVLQAPNLTAPAPSAPPPAANTGGGTKTQTSPPADSAAPRLISATFDTAPEPALTRVTDTTPPPAKDAGGTTPGTTDTPDSAPSNASAAGALALVRMNEDYMHQGVVDLLITSCINEFDPTRLRPKVDAANQTRGAVNGPGVERAYPDVFKPGDTAPAATAPPPPPAVQQAYEYGHNTWLENVCNSINGVSILKIIAMGAAQSNPAWNPVNPEAAVGKPTDKPGANDPAPKTADDSKAPATVKAVQAALAKLACAGCKGLTPDGQMGPNTVRAVSSFQAANKLPVNGDALDPATVAKLGLQPAAVKAGG